RCTPSAPPTGLRAVAPQAFPQRAILPRPGATMSARPWIRAASNGWTPTNGGPPMGGGHPQVGGGGAPMAGGTRMDTGHAYARNFPGHASASPPSSAPPHIYNPPRPFTAAASRAYGSGPRTFGPAAHGSTQA